MRVRVRFEFQAGACLWADDAEARERWISAVSAQDAALPDELAREAEALMTRWDAAIAADDPARGPRWEEAEARQFQVEVEAWTRRVREVLAAQGIDLAVDASESGAPAAPVSAPYDEGEVVACFPDPSTRASAAGRWNPDFTWNEAATWQAVNLHHGNPLSATPLKLLTQLEAEPAFICGWWQESCGGSSPLLAGDPSEHAIACVRDRNATGLANYLSWMRVQRVHLSPELANAAWTPSPRHRLASPSGSIWEWWSFFRTATATLQGRKASPRYLESERDRLFWRWTHGGSRGGWPASPGEALERIGLRRESFQRWVRPAGTIPCSNEN